MRSPFLSWLKGYRESGSERDTNSSSARRWFRRARKTAKKRPTKSSREKPRFRRLKKPSRSRRPKSRGTKPVPKAPQRDRSYYYEYLEDEKDLVEFRIEWNGCPKSEMGNFELRTILAEGDFGAVLSAHELREHEPCVIKVIPKITCIKTEKVEAVIRAKQIQYAVRSDFTVRLWFAFQDSVDLFLVMEHVNFLHHSMYYNSQNEYEIKLIAAQIVLALEYLHTCNIIHRDLKLESVFVSANDFIKLGNFECAKQVFGTTSSFCGTLPYMAPEIIQGQSYGRGVDWWSLGVLLYILLYDEYPFTENDASDALNKQKILRGELECRWILKSPLLPSAEMKKFIQNLLERDVTERLGVLGKGCEDVKSDPWFKDIDFRAILNKAAGRITFEPVKGIHLKAGAIPTDFGERAKKKGRYKEFKGF